MTDLPGTRGPGPIADAREGMSVVDESGDEIGTVKEVRMGNPEAVTSAGQSMETDLGFMGDVADAFGGSDDLSEHDQERLARVGFLRVDRGLLKGDAYVAGDRVLRVSGDTVHVQGAQATGR